MISLIFNDRDTSHFNMSSVQCASICGKTCSKLAYALISRTESGQRLGGQEIRRWEVTRKEVKRQEVRR